MLYGIALPPYELIKKFEGQGNWAIKKYYQFPFNIFYKKKLKMIIDMLTPGKIYRNILDFGGGAAEIFKKELGKHAMSVTSYNLPITDPRWRFDVIVCGSVLEFVDLEKTMHELRGALAPGGILIAASPMSSWLSRFYFWIIGDKKKRHNQHVIHNFLSQFFQKVEYKEWFGLYFVMKVKKK